MVSKNIIKNMKKNNPMFNRDSVLKAILTNKKNKENRDILKLKYIKDNITTEQEQVILGSVIADGRLDKSSQNSNFVLCHCLKQKEYLFWKADKLVDIFGDYKIYQYKNKNLLQVRFKSNPYFTYLHLLIHKKNKSKRNIPIEIVSKLTNLGLLILFLDDGTNHENGYAISRKDKSDRKKIVAILKNNGISSSLLDEIVYIKKSETHKLTSILKNFNIPKCMRYKIKNE